MARKYNITETYPRVIASDGTRPGVSRVVVIDSAGNKTTVWTPASKSTQDDYEDGDLVEYDRTDNFAITSTSSDVFEGTYAVGNAPSGEEYLVASAGSLPVDFTTGDVWHVPFKITTGAASMYWGDQDTTPSNQYEIVVQEGGGTTISVDDSGTKTDLDQVGGAAVYGGLDGYHHLFLEWDPAQFSGQYDPEDSDGSHTGDFLVTVTDGDYIPRVQTFVDANDTLYRSGGIALVVGGGQEAYFDFLEVGDRQAFSNYSPNRLHESGEIDTWNNWRLDDWGENPGEFRLTGDPEITPAVGEFCLKNPPGQGFSRIGAVPGNGFPNLLPDGQQAELYVRADALGGIQTVLGAYADSNNWSRVEIRRGEDRIRVVDQVSGNSTVHADDGSLGLKSGVWEKVTVGRTTSGDIRFVVADADGGTYIDHQHTLDDSLANNDGVAVGASNNDTETLYFDDFRQV